MTSSSSIKFFFPTPGAIVSRQGQLQVPEGWTAQVLGVSTADDEPGLETAELATEPYGDFVDSQSIPLADAHLLDVDGQAYSLNAPRPYHVRFTAPVSQTSGEEYNLRLLFFANWYNAFGGDRQPPEEADHAQVRFVFGDQTADWQQPQHLQVNDLPHTFVANGAGDTTAGFEVRSRYPATSNGLYLQSFSLASATDESMEAGALHKVVVNLLPQDVSLREKWHILFNTHEKRQPILQSHDDAINLVTFGSDDSVIRLWGRDRLNQDQVEAIDKSGLNVEDIPLTGIDLQPLPESGLEGAFMAVVNLLPQDATLLEKWQVLQAVHSDRQSMMQSHDDAIFLIERGGPGSFIRLWSPGRFAQDQRDDLRDSGVSIVEELLREPAKPDPSGDFRFTHWPAEHNFINQHFGANAAIYQKHGLPGHEGIDIRAPFGSKIMAVADGKVAKVDENHTAYGVTVRIKHRGSFQTVYAHLEKADVEEGQSVKGGEVIGRADSTGNVWPKPTPENPHAGSHLHLSLKLLDGSTTIYPFAIVDPTPFLKVLPEYPKDVVVVSKPRPKGQRFDLLAFMSTPSRVVYEVRHPDGGQERFQTHSEGGKFYYVKNAHWEELWADGSFIWRGFDTSPGDGRYYIQKDPGRDGARWVNRFMRLGETFTGQQAHHVQFFNTADCSKSDLNSGGARNQTTLFAYHKELTWNGITVKDVIELGKAGGEHMWFAKGFGLVAWTSAWGQSAISEVHDPGARPDNVREVIPCLSR